MRIVSAIPRRLQRGDAETRRSLRAEGDSRATRRLRSASSAPPSLGVEGRARLPQDRRSGRFEDVRFPCGFVVALLLAGVNSSDAQVCVGDCNGNGAVTVDELVQGV